MINRRNFRGMGAAAGLAGLGTAGCASMGVAPAVLPAKRPNSRLKFAVIGCGAQGSSDLKTFSTHRRIDMAAFCDVDMLMLDKLRPKFPKANYYQNWREMLDKEAPDAVMVATPDHWHCEIMSEVMRRGIHLYAEKPLCRTFAECRQLESLAKSSGVVTQLGTQIAAWECDRHTAAILRRGDIGEVKKVYLFTNTGYYAKLLDRKWPLNAEKAPVPSTLDWKGWLGPAPYRDYVPNRYHSFVWRVWRDFGTGWLGDMGSHIFSPVWLGMDLGTTAPISAKANVLDLGWNAEMKKQFISIFSHIVFKFPGVKATGMKPFEVEWCDGPALGKVPKEFLPDGETEKISGNRISDSVPAEYLPPAALKALAEKSQLGSLPIQGRVVEGTNGWLISTHFNQPPVVLDAKGNPKPFNLPFLEPVANHYHDFVDCCLDGGKPVCDLSWTTKLTDWIILGQLAIDNPGKEVKII